MPMSGARCATRWCDEMIDYETLIYGPIFDMYGRTATYRPPTGGGAVDCVVVRNRRDVDLADFNVGQPIVAGDLIKVRASEIAEPMKGGTFTIGSEVVKITEDPRCEESERLVWTMAVRPSS